MEVNALRIYKQISLLLFTFSLAISPDIAFGSAYVGSKACAQCHESEYAAYSQHSKKAYSWKAVTKMASDLKPNELQECYACHTTGYGQGGFVSIEQTPHLADVGCETCHGPGKEHSETGDPTHISRQITIKACEACHNSERVGSFNFKPLVHSGAH
ncbi:cytochrome c family protein [Desulfocurvibacter africanus]|uniref:cytochrome c family protein n=1 Tax=Desulfocurvibacter africanus TaxID=873 RepID=UPI00040CA6E3|nr:cytochrome c family protein [Desulfocurvibacter africanus]